MTDKIPTEIESEYVRFQKLGFRKLWLVFNNIKNIYEVLIFNPDLCKQSEWYQVIKNNQ